MPRKHLTLKQKLRLIKYYDQGYTGKELHHIFGVTEPTVYNIVRNHKSILEQIKSGTSLTKKNRKLTGKQIDDKVYVWLKQRKYRNAPINDTLIRTKAKYFAKKLGSSYFKPTDTWLDNFKKNHPGEFDSVETGNSVDKLIESVREQLIELDSAENNDEIAENNDNCDNVFTPASPDPSINEEETPVEDNLFEEAPVEDNSFEPMSPPAPVEDNAFTPASPPPNDDDNVFEPMSPAPSNNEETDSGKLPLIIIEEALSGDEENNAVTYKEPSTPISIDIEDKNESAEQSNDKDNSVDMSIEDSIYEQISPSSPLEMAIDSVHEQSTSPALEDNVADIFNDFIHEQPSSITPVKEHDNAEESAVDISYIVIDKTPNSDEENVVDMLVDPVDEQSNIVESAKSPPLIVISSPDENELIEPPLLIVDKAQLGNKPSTSNGDNSPPSITIYDASEALGVLNTFLEQNPQYYIKKVTNLINNF
ncbi:Tigger transposable element-derived protein 4-like, protein [Aphelenchoides bicaudatus]|nr:Tigger transposable element-derived protein 4-like, protein [Aphelenchoides bicaudatus]